MKKKQSALSFFFNFLLYNLCFFCLQAALLFSQNSNFVRNVQLPEIVWMEILATVGVHLFIYLLLSLIQAFLLLGILKRSWHYFSTDQWQMVIWGLFVCAILSANTYYFPLSVFSKLFSPPIPELFMISILSISVLALGLLFINGLCNRKGLYVLVVAIPAILFFTRISPDAKAVPNNPVQLDTKPNVILLGIDSLSPESINPESMPFFSKLLSDSTQFTNAISPLARTYPAWASILTGLYTEHHHADENLVPRSSVKSEASIAWILKQQGYNTIFGTDDRRFNSIDKEFGFNKVIGPKLGVNDVLLGSFNDFPLSNLLINFRISSWLFPFNYSNRASFFSYYPQTFNAKLQHDLAPDAPNTPVFLAVHFTLPHWPYAWAESLPDQVNNEFSLEKRDILYQHSLKRIDKQFQTFFIYLQQQRYFENTLLILLSDHGEVLYYPNSRQTNYRNYKGTLPSRFAEYLKEKTATVLNKSAGHGSDILSPKQYHSVLGFRIYKRGQLITHNNKINKRVALIDLAPTILDFLHLSDQQKMDGISLLQSVLNPSYTLPQRIFFLESGIFPNQELSKKKAMEIGELFYFVNPKTGQLEIKSDKLKFFDNQKLYGIIKNDWVLALYPNEKTYIAVIQNLNTGSWIDDLHSDFAKSTPADQMYQEMNQFYGKKLFLPLP